MPTPHPFSQVRLWTRLLAPLVGLAGWTEVQAEKLVVVRSTADADYSRSRWVEGVRRQESYVFSPGSFIPGESLDRSLERMPFISVAQMLAADLKRQDYVPAAGVANADLLLVVHWGATGRVEQSYDLEARSFDSARELGEQFAEQKAFEEDAARSNQFLPAAVSSLGGLAQSLDHEISNLHSNQITSGIGTESTARLLGFTQAFRREANSLIYSDTYRTLLEMTKEERYFIIVMAYDLALLRKQGKLKRVWSLRASIRSAGVNFQQAVDRISVVAGNHFGQPQDDVVFDRRTERSGRVEVGEITVLGTAAERPPARTPARSP